MLTVMKTNDILVKYCAFKVMRRSQHLRGFVKPFFDKTWKLSDVEKMK